MLLILNLKFCLILIVDIIVFLLILIFFENEVVFLILVFLKLILVFELKNLMFLWVESLIVFNEIFVWVDFEFKVRVFGLLILVFLILIDVFL